MYATGSVEEAEQFNRLTLARVGGGDDEPWRLWVAVAAYYVFVAYALKLFYDEWTLYAAHRRQFLAVGDPDMPVAARYAAVAEQIDDSQLRGDLPSYLERLFPAQILSVSRCLETADLEKLMRERQAIVLRLEAVVAKQHAAKIKKR